MGLEGAGLAVHERLIRSLVRLDEPGDDFAATASLSVAGGVGVELDTRGSIDIAAERARLEKDRAAAEKETAQCRAKLDNPAFTDKAPDAVVEKIRERLAAAEPDLARIVSALEALPAMTSSSGPPHAYEKAEAELAARGTSRMVFDLSRIEALLDLLGSPERAYPAIHLTGTNGKTSTARIIDSLLRAHGLRTGPTQAPTWRRSASASASTGSRLARRSSSRSSTRSLRWLGSLTSRGRRATSR